MTAQENYLHQMLETLRAHLLTMGAKSVQAVEDACHALTHRDADLAHRVIAEDRVIDAMENELDEDALNILARSQPVARDLRLAIAGVRMVLDLERIGDEAALIAQRALQLCELPTSPLISELDAYGTRSANLTREAIRAFQDGDIDRALTVCRSDPDTAAMTEDVIHNIMDSVVQQTVDPRTGMYALMIIRALDRVCRRAQNIAEHTYFMVKGVNIKHRPNSDLPADK